MADVHPHLDPPNSSCIIPENLPPTRTPNKRSSETDLEATDVEEKSGVEFKLVNPDTLFQIGVEEVCSYSNAPEWITYPAMEVFAVLVEDLKSPYLYGKIEIHGSFGVLKLFEREKPSGGVLPTESSSLEDIIFENQYGEDELLQTGPTKKSMAAVARILIDMKFMNDVSKKTCEHVFSFQPEANPFFIDPNYNDCLLSATIKNDEIGSFALKYAVFDYPLVAKVEVVLLQQHIINRGDDCEKNTYTCADHVTGTVYAKNSYYEDRSTLFYRNNKKKTPENMVDGKGVIPDDGNLVIPLSKSIVTLPHGAELKIGVNLKDSISGITICNGFVEFTNPPVFNQRGGYVKKIPDIKIIDNKIQVTVTWSRW